MTPFLYLLALGLALGGVAVRLYLWWGRARLPGEATGPASQGRFSSGFRAQAVDDGPHGVEGPQEDKAVGQPPPPAPG